MDSPKRKLTEHQALYEHFIGSQEIILSLPVFFRWTHNPFLLCEGNTLKEKLPIRIYMGASFLPHGAESEIKNIYCYNTHRNTYHQYPREHLLPRYKEWKEKLATLLPRSVAFTIIIETEPGKGFEVHEHTASLFAYMTALLTEAITPQELTQGIACTKQRDSLHELCRTFYHLLCPKRATLSLSPLITTPHTPRRLWKTDQEMTPLPEESPLPFFYSIIYSGVQADKQLIKSNEEEPADKQGMKQMAPHVEALAEELKETLLKIQSEGGNPEHLPHFFHLITLTNLYHHHHRTPHPAIKSLSDLLHQHCAHTSHKQFATVPISYSHLGGSILLCYTNRETEYCIRELLKQKQAEGYPYTLEWSSTEGQEEEGIRIEQYQELGIGGTQTEKEELTIWRNGDKEHVYIPKEQYEKVRQETDLFLDVIQGKIWIGGKPMSSKELHSQNQTIFLLQAILEHPAQQISNHELPRSSYSTNRNEISSKILSPLKRILKEEGRGECPFVLEGRLGTFQIGYQKSPLSIGIRSPKNLHSKKQSHTGKNEEEKSQKK